MLNSLHVENYRNLQKLIIPSFAQINLIAGKNNTGKSALLEAISLFASKGDISNIRGIQERRGENFVNSGSLNFTTFNIKILSSLFTNHQIGFEEKNRIFIGEGAKKYISFQLVRYIDELIKDNQGQYSRRTYITTQNEDKFSEVIKYGFEIKTETEIVVYPLENIIGNLILGRKVVPENFQYVPSNSLLTNNANAVLFDNISLSEKEPYVIEALKVIDSSVEGLTFRQKAEKNFERIAVVKLADQVNPIPILNMGDGMNRILSIILALVNANNGYLLVDEFENGLHYTVQEQIWRIIFKLSRQLNVQVFATTHSNDCISGFEEAMNDSENSIGGKLIRLDNIGGVIQPTEYSSEELRIANNRNIEIR